MVKEIEVKVRLTKQLDSMDLGDLEKLLHEHLKGPQTTGYNAIAMDDSIKLKCSTTYSFDELSNLINGIYLGDLKLEISLISCTNPDVYHQKQTKIDMKKVKKSLSSKPLAGEPKKPEDVTATLSQNLPPPSTSSHSSSPTSQSSILDVTRILLPTPLHRSLRTINKYLLTSIEESYNVQINLVNDESTWQEPEDIVSIHGSTNACYEACRELIRNLYDSESPRIVFKHLTYDFICGRIIGKEGRNLKKIIDETKAKIMFSNSIFDRSLEYGDERVVHYDGSFESVMNAFKIINHRIRDLAEKQLSSLWDYSGMSMNRNSSVAPISTAYFLPPPQHAYYMQGVNQIPTSNPQDLSTSTGGSAYAPYMMPASAAPYQYFGLNQTPTFIPTLPIYSAVCLEHMCMIESGVPYEMLGACRSEGHTYVIECFVQVPLESVPFIETRERIIRDHYTNKNVVFEVLMPDKSIRTIISALQSSSHTRHSSILLSQASSTSEPFADENHRSIASEESKIECDTLNKQFCFATQIKELSIGSNEESNPVSRTVTPEENVQTEKSSTKNHSPRPVSPSLTDEASSSSLVHYRIVGDANTQWDIQLRIFSGVANSIGTPDPRLKIEAIIPGSSVGRIIGKNGSVVNSIQENSGAYVQIPKDRQGGTMTPVIISGTFFSIQCALMRIRDIVYRTIVNRGERSSTSASGDTDAISTSLVNTTSEESNNNPVISSDISTASLRQDSENDSSMM